MRRTIPKAKVVAILRPASRLAVMVGACSIGASRFVLVKWVPALLLLALLLAPFWSGRWRRWRRAKTPEERALLRKPGWGLPLVILMVVTWPVGFYVHVRIAEHKLGSLVETAKRYQNEHGRCSTTSARAVFHQFTDWKYPRYKDDTLWLYDYSPWLGSLEAYYVCYSGILDDPHFVVSFNTFSNSAQRIYDSRVGRWRF